MIAILGGGISGLTAAYQLKRANQSFALLEADSKVGGKVQTTQKDGFTMEHGPNTVLINNGETRTLIEQLGLSEELIFADSIATKNRFVLKNNSIEPLPSNLSTAIKSQLFGLSTLGALLKEPFIKKSTSLKEESLADFCRRRLGAQIFEDFITPFVTGIYAGNPEKMSANYTLNLFKEAEEQYGSLLIGMRKIVRKRKEANATLNLPKQKIFTFKKGLYHLIATLHRAIEKQVHLDSVVTSIEAKNNHYLIHYKQGDEEKELKASQIIAALPAYKLAPLISSLSTRLSTKLNDIAYVPALSVQLGFSTEQMKFKKKTFGILSRKAEQAPFLGILFNSHFFPHTAPKGKELLTVICGGTNYPEIMVKSEEDILKEVRHSVSELLGIEGTFELQSVVKWQKGIPQYNLGYGEIEKQIDLFLAEQTNFHIAANFYKGVSVSDCIQNATQLVNRLE